MNAIFIWIDPLNIFAALTFILHHSRSSFCQFNRTSSLSFILLLIQSKIFGNNKVTAVFLVGWNVRIIWLVRSFWCTCLHTVSLLFIILPINLHLHIITLFVYFLLIQIHFLADRTGLFSITKYLDEYAIQFYHVWSLTQGIGWGSLH